MLLLATLLACSSSAHAQGLPTQPSASADSSQVTVVAPRLIQSFDADYPADALAAKLEGSVVMRLTIDKGGLVIKVDVVEPAGHGFDEAAADVVKKFRFEPGRRGDVPVAAQILYRYTFRLPDAASSKDTPPMPSKAPDVPSKAPDVALEAAPSKLASTPTPVSVTVRGKSSAAKELRDSANAVTVVETRHAKQQTRDLGEVLASVEGVAVRRMGGLGSFSRFSLNGLYDNQVRFFLDGLPLDVVAGSSNVANIPVNFVDRIEIYRGVLPVRFGADALGGAVNLVTDQQYKSGGYASFQRGSFGTYRASLAGGYHHEPSNFVVRGVGWLDSARNDYQIEAEIADKSGATKPTLVRRLHDAYRSYGGALQLGFIDTPWADRLLVQLFGSASSKELQNNTIMSIPYGEAKYGGDVYGGAIRYEKSLLPSLSVSAVVSASRRSIYFLDTTTWIYDWDKKRIGRRTVPGEVLRQPHDSTIWENNVFGRAMVEWRMRPEQALRLASTTRHTVRTGKETASTGPLGTDPLAGERNFFTLMTGLEHTLDAFDMRPEGERREQSSDPSRDYRLQNMAFVKHYLYAADAKGIYVFPDLDDVDLTDHRFGIGDGLRFRFTDWLLAKASYEWATRLPSIDELYGDGISIIPSTELLPETSHNVNLGLRLDVGRTPVGRFVAEANGFLREADRLISQLADPLTFQYKNIPGARSVGVETLVSWVSPGNWLVLDGNTTWQDVRNTSSDGEFADYSGDRIPNYPWLFANWSGRVQWRGVMLRGDELSPFYTGRYVHEFFRNWESIGDLDFKAAVPTQIYHSLGLSYSTRWPVRSSVTLEVDNVTDSKVYDFFGVQRPGRSFSIKVVEEI